MDEMVFGVFSRAGEGKYIMRIATGALAGSAFTFAKENSSTVAEIKKKLLKANQEQEIAAKNRSLASRKALEGIMFDFSQ